MMAEHAVELQGFLSDQLLDFIQPPAQADREVADIDS